ncbi:hypothetical protein NUM3379_39000 [Kineococcus sp. NUM-3379]
MLRRSRAGGLVGAGEVVVLKRSSWVLRSFGAGLDVEPGAARRAGPQEQAVAVAASLSTVRLHCTYTVYVNACREQDVPGASNRRSIPWSQRTGTAYRDSHPLDRPAGAAPR